jgi:flagellin
MALTILNNIAAIAAENQLNITSNSLDSTLEQLSSGSRINSGADDPAGLAIANGLEANIAALTQSSSNATDGVGELQVADGALSQVTTLLNRAVTLATESATDTVSNTQRVALDSEYQSIKAEIDSIGSTTNYNGGQVFTNNTLNVFLSDGSVSGSSTIGVATGLLSSTDLGVGGTQATATLTQQGEVNAAAATANLAGGQFTAGTATSIFTAGSIVGSTQATGTITTNGTIPDVGDQVTVGATVYTFKTTLTTNGDVLIGSNGATSLANLVAAINLSAGVQAVGTDTYWGATPNATVEATSAGNIASFTARANGTTAVPLSVTTNVGATLTAGGVTGLDADAGTQGSTVTIGGTTYQFVNALDNVVTGTANANSGIANQVLVGSSTAASLANLAEAVNLTQGGDQGTGGQYGALTAQNANVSAGTPANGALTFTALAAGTTLNGVTPTVSSAGVGTFSTFAGGGNPSTVTLGTTTYTFVSAVSGTTYDQVLIGTSQLATLANLANAINHANTDTAGSGASGTGYYSAAANTLASAGTATASGLVLTAASTGVAGNNTVLTNTAGATGAFGGGAAQINAGGNVVAGDAVDVGGQTYNFVTALSTTPTANQVVVGTSEAATFANLANAVNGAPTGAGTTYSSNTVANASVTAATTATPLSVVFTATQGGTAGNALVATATPEGTVPDLSFGTGATAGFTGGGKVPSDLLTSADAQSALTLIDSAVAQVAALRGNIGGTVNRLQSASNVINNQVQNLTAAENNVTAADIPTAVANLTQYSILEQTGISALAQANQQQQLVLKLLT